MKALKLILILILLNLPLRSAKAQVLFSAQDYLLTNQNLLLVNPSYGGYQLKGETSLHYNGQTGVKKVINSTQAHVVLALGDVQKSRVGLLLQNHNEGKFIQNSNLQLLFNYNILKNTEHQFIVGGLVGVSNLRIKSNGITSQGSSWAPMNTIGVVFAHQKNWRVGVSYSNLLKSELSPVKEKFQLSKEVVTSMDKTFLWGVKHELMPSYVMFLQHNTIQHHVALKYKYVQKISIAVGVRNKSLTWSLGLENLTIGKGKLKFLFGSGLATQSAINSSKYEWFTSYYFK